MNGTSNEIGTISRRAVAAGVSLLIGLTVLWMSWMTTKVIDISVNIGTLTERVAGIQRFIDTDADQRGRP